MAYIGNTPAENFVSVVKQDITGNGGTSYTLNHPVSSPGELEVFVNHVQQEPTTAYTVAGTTLTFTEAVVAGDDIYVIFRGRTMGTVEHPAGAALTATSGTFSGAVGMQGLTATTSDFSGEVYAGGSITLDGNDFANHIAMTNNGTGGTTFKMFNTSDAYSQPSAHWMLHHASAGNGIILADQTGNVTMPYQPFAAVTIGNPNNTTSGGLYTTGSVQSNSGNCWSSSTHRFTAPAGGSYIFTVTGYTNFTTGYGYLSLYKNGSNYKTHHYNHNGTQIHTIATHSIGIPLAATDYLEFRRGGGGNGNFAELYLTIFKAS